MPLDLVQKDQHRISRELASAQARLKEATHAIRKLETHVDAALALITNAHSQYLALDPIGRQLMNRAVFEAIWIGDKDIEGAQVKPGLADLIADDIADTLADDEAGTGKGPNSSLPKQKTQVGSAIGDKSNMPNDQITVRDTAGTPAGTKPEHPSYVADQIRSQSSELVPGHTKNLRHIYHDGGSNIATLVPRKGLEPSTDSCSPLDRDLPHQHCYNHRPTQLAGSAPASQGRTCWP